MGTLGNNTCERFEEHKGYTNISDSEEVDDQTPLLYEPERTMYQQTPLVQIRTEELEMRLLSESLPSAPNLRCQQKLEARPKRTNTARRNGNQPEFDFQKWQNENIFPVTYTDEEREKARERIAKTVEKYSDELVEQWNKEIDGLLTFAGLFSAILSAFNVQSYQLLQPAASDHTNALLTQMSNQLASFRTSAPFVNSTQPAYNNLFPNPPPFVAPTYAIWMNTLWFVSLVFSLASSTIGIIVKQWIKEYNTGLYGFSHEIARRRQHRLDNLEKWRVAQIIAIVPLLLLIAVVLFLAGLVILLYSLHGTVASIVSSFIGCLLFFVAATTLLPTLSKSCCYYSPQAYAFFRLWRAIFSAFQWVVKIVIEGFYRSLAWMWVRCNMTVIYNAYKYSKHLRSKPLGSPVWRSGEQEVYTGNQDQLDASTLIAAYTATLDPRCIEDSIASLSGTVDGAPWEKYIIKLNTVLRSRASPVHWPSNLASTFSKLLAISSCIHIRRAPDTAPDCHFESFFPTWNTVATAFVEEVDETTDASICVAALRAANRQYKLVESDQLWHRHAFGELTGWIEEAVTYRAVAAAAANRLHGLAHDPALCPSSLDFGVVYWDLTFVAQHISVIQELLEHPKADSGPDWFPAISPVVAYALDSIQKILENLDMHASGRSLTMESLWYEAILLNVELISEGPCGNTLITSALVRSLINTFSRLFGEESWDGMTGSTTSNVKECRVRLARLKSRYLQIPTASVSPQMAM